MNTLKIHGEEWLYKFVPGGWAGKIQIEVWRGENDFYGNWQWYGLRGFGTHNRGHRILPRAVRKAILEHANFRRNNDMNDLNDTAFKLRRIADLRERMTHHGMLTIRHAGPQGTDVDAAVVVLTARELEWLIEEAERGVKLT